VFSIGTINLPETIQFVKTKDVEIMDIDMNTSISKQRSKVKAQRRRYLTIDLNQK
jgi:hypothetical protein